MTRGAIAAGLVALACATPVAAAVPRVQILVAGKSQVLGGPKVVGARAATVKVARRRCAISAASPLAALAALRRAGGPAFTLHDYGSCGRRVADGAALYVRRIGPDAAAGPNGWVYKVRRRVPGSGAADPAGIRLRGGERLLWFYCHMGSHGCQRTLELSVPAATAPGTPLPARVRGYDDQGHGVAIAGATITLAGAAARTGPDGSATLVAPAAPGRYPATVTAPGLVPSFPSLVRVR